MKRLSLVPLLVLSCIAHAALAHSKPTPPADSSAYEPAQASTPSTETDEASNKANAAEAVIVVEQFGNAIAAGDIEKAGSFLEANVLILESGGAEHDAAEYLSGHATEDAAFLKSVQVKLLRRTAKAVGDLAWVGSETEMQRQKDGKSITILGTETMVLKRGADGWKIIHIHWSSHTRKN